MKRKTLKATIVYAGHAKAKERVKGKKLFEGAVYPYTMSPSTSTSGQVCVLGFAGLKARESGIYSSCLSSLSPSIFKKHLYTVAQNI